MDSLVTAAKEYLNAGLSIIALSGKMPNGKVHPHGLNEPLSGAIRPHTEPWGYNYDSDCEGCQDDDLIEKVFNHEDTTGIGIVLGNGLCVVDIDGEDGAKTFTELVPREAWRHTASVSTGRGMHLYFMRFLETRTTKLGEKLDLKGVGGYVAAPPSLHPSGTRYEWMVPLLVDGRVCVEYLPDELEEFLRAREILNDTKVRREPASMFTMDPTTKPWTWARVDVDVNLSGLVNTVVNSKDGERNNVLNWAAYRAMEDGVPYTDALRELGAAAADAGLEAQEIQQTIRSAYRGHR